MKKLMTVVMSALCAAVTYGEDVELVAGFRAAAATDPSAVTFAVNGESKESWMERPGTYAYDGSDSSYWLSGAISGTAAATLTIHTSPSYENGYLAKVNSYKITSAASTTYKFAYPTAWELQGSQDGVNWVAIDSRTESDATTSFVSANSIWSATFTCPDSTAAYPYIRLYVTAVAQRNAAGTSTFSADKVSIRELRLYGEIVKPQVLVASSFDFLDGVIPSFGQVGDIPVGGSRTFIAPPDTEYGVSNYVCNAYSLATWDEEGQTWSDPVQYAGKSVELANDGVFRKLTWVWTDTSMVREVHISKDGDGSDGYSKATAYRTFEEAKALLKTAATVVLYEETYTLSEPIVLDGIHNLTMVGAGADKTFIEPAEGVSCRHLTANDCADCMFSGVTFRNGLYSEGGNVVGNVVTGPEGGSMRLEGSFGMRFENCAFVGNTAKGVNGAKTFASCRGGALYLKDSTAAAVGCLFVSNAVNCATSGMSYSPRSSSGGGAVYGTGSCFAATDCVFMYNRADGRAYGNTGISGAAVCSGRCSSAWSFENCLFARNGGVPTQYTCPTLSTVQFGGGTGSSYRTLNATFTHCTFAENRVAANVYTGDAKATVDDSILVDANDVYLGDNAGASATLTHCAWDRHDADICRGVYSVDATSVRCDSPFGTAFTVPADSPAFGLGYTYPVAPVGSCRTWYVAADGLDTNDGSQGAPFRTVTRALAAAAETDRISVGAGVYSRTNGETFPWLISGRSELTIEGAGKGEVFVDGEGVVASNLVRIVGASRIALSGMTFRNGATATAGATGSCGLFVNDSARVTIADCAFTGFRYLPTEKQAASTFSGVLAFSRAQGVVVRRCEFSDITLVTAGCTKAHSLNGAAIMASASGVDAWNCTVTGNAAGDNATVRGWAVYSVGENIDSTVANIRNFLVVRNGYVEGTTTKGTLSAVQCARGAITLECCTVADNESCGINCENAKSSQYFLHVRNTIVFGHEDDLVNCEAVNPSGNSCSCLEFANVLLPTGVEDYQKVKHTVNGVVYAKACSGMVDAASAGFKNAEKGRYTLTYDSAAVDKAVSLWWMDLDGATDLAGNPRISKSTRKGEELPDIGCYELGCYTPGLMLMVK